jgi:hypothetical protein
MVVEGELDRAAAVKVFNALHDAAAEVGLPEPEITRTIASAMRSTS